jgi:hypothetical protein
MSHLINKNNSFDLSSIDELVNKVFTYQPQAPSSIQLEIINGKNSHDIFKTLGLLLTHGIQYMYGENLQFDNIDIPRIQKYIASVGWKAIINPNSVDDHQNALPYMLRIPCGKVYFNVIFEALRVCGDQ